MKISTQVLAIFFSFFIYIAILMKEVNGVSHGAIMADGTNGDSMFAYMAVRMR